MTVERLLKQIAELSNISLETVHTVLKGTFTLKNLHALRIPTTACKNIILINFFLKFKNCNDGRLSKILTRDKTWAHYLI